MINATLRSLLPAAVLVGIAMAPLAGQAATATETRSLPEFTAIAASGSVNVSVSQGPVTSVQVTADDKVLANIETVVEAGRRGPTLQIRLKREGWGWAMNYNTGPVNVVIVTPKLTALASAGSGDIRVGALQTPALQLSISGSGNAWLSGLDADELGISIAGSGDVSYSGDATVKSSVAGSGTVKKR